MLWTPLVRALTIPEEDNMSLLEELWHYFNDRYFTPEFGVYDNFEIASGTLLSIKMILIGLVVGLLVGGVMSIYNKRVLGEAVHRLLRNGGVGRANAKTLAELDLQKNVFIRASLKRGYTLRRMVKCREEEEYWGRTDRPAEETFPAEEAKPKAIEPPKATEIPKGTAYRMDVDTAHFYISERDQYAAAIKFNRRGTDWLGFGVCAVLSIGFLVLAFYFLPDLMQMLDNFINLFKNQ